MFLQVFRPAFLRAVIAVTVMAFAWQPLAARECCCMVKPAESDCCAESESTVERTAVGIHHLAAADCDCCRSGRCSTPVASPVRVAMAAERDEGSDSSYVVLAPTRVAPIAQTVASATASPSATICGALDRCILLSRFAL